MSGATQYERGLWPFKPADFELKSRWLNSRSDTYYKVGPGWGALDADQCAQVIADTMARNLNFQNGTIGKDQKAAARGRAANQIEDALKQVVLSFIEKYKDRVMGDVNKAAQIFMCLLDNREITSHGVEKDETGQEMLNFLRTKFAEVNLPWGKTANNDLHDEFDCINKLTASSLDLNKSLEGDRFIVSLLDAFAEKSFEASDGDNVVAAASTSQPKQVQKLFAYLLTTPETHERKLDNLLLLKTLSEGQQTSLINLIQRGLTLEKVQELLSTKSNLQTDFGGQTLNSVQFMRAAMQSVGQALPDAAAPETLIGPPLGGLMTPVPDAAASVPGSPAVLPDPITPLVSDDAASSRGSRASSVESELSDVPELAAAATAAPSSVAGLFADTDIRGPNLFAPDESQIVVYTGGGPGLKLARLKEVYGNLNNFTPNHLNSLEGSSPDENFDRLRGEHALLLQALNDLGGNLTEQQITDLITGNSEKVWDTLILLKYPNLQSNLAFAKKCTGLTPDSVEGQLRAVQIQSLWSQLLSTDYKEGMALAILNKLSGELNNSDIRKILEKLTPDDWEAFVRIGLDSIDMEVIKNHLLGKALKATSIDYECIKTLLGITDANFASSVLIQKAAEEAKTTTPERDAGKAFQESKYYKLYVTLEGSSALKALIIDGKLTDVEKIKARYDLSKALQLDASNISHKAVFNDLRDKVNQSEIAKALLHDVFNVMGKDHYLPMLEQALGDTAPVPAANIAEVYEKFKSKHHRNTAAQNLQDDFIKNYSQGGAVLTALKGTQNESANTSWATGNFGEILDKEKDKIEAALKAPGIADDQMAAKLAEKRFHFEQEKIQTIEDVAEILVRNDKKTPMNAEWITKLSTATPAVAKPGEATAPGSSAAELQWYLRDIVRFSEKDVTDISSTDLAVMQFPYRDRTKFLKDDFKTVADIKKAQAVYKAFVGYQAAASSPPLYGDLAKAIMDMAAEDGRTLPDSQKAAIQARLEEALEHKKDAASQAKCLFEEGQAWKIAKEFREVLALIQGAPDDVRSGWKDEETLKEVLGSQKSEVLKALKAQIKNLHNAVKSALADDPVVAPVSQAAPTAASGTSAPAAATAPASPPTILGKFLKGLCGGDLPDGFEDKIKTDYLKDVNVNDVGTLLEKLGSKQGKILYLFKVQTAIAQFASFDEAKVKEAIRTVIQARARMFGIEEDSPAEKALVEHFTEQWLSKARETDAFTGSKFLQHVQNQNKQLNEAIAKCSKFNQKIPNTLPDERQQEILLEVLSADDKAELELKVSKDESSAFFKVKSLSEDKFQSWKSSMRLPAQQWAYSLADRVGADNKKWGGKEHDKKLKQLEVFFYLLLSPELDARWSHHEELQGVRKAVQALRQGETFDERVKHLVKQFPTCAEYGQWAEYGEKVVGKAGELMLPLPQADESTVKITFESAVVREFAVKTFKERFTRRQRVSVDETDDGFKISHPYGWSMRLSKDLNKIELEGISADDRHAALLLKQIAPTGREVASIEASSKSEYLKTFAALDKQGCVLSEDLARNLKTEDSDRSRALKEYCEAKVKRMGKNAQQNGTADDWLRKFIGRELADAWKKDKYSVLYNLPTLDDATSKTLVTLAGPLPLPAKSAPVPGSVAVKGASSRTPAAASSVQSASAGGQAGSMPFTKAVAGQVASADQPSVLPPVGST